MNKKLVEKAKWQNKYQGWYTRDVTYELIKIYFANNNDYKKLVGQKIFEALYNTI